MNAAHLRYYNTQAGLERDIATKPKKNRRLVAPVISGNSIWCWK